MTQQEIRELAYSKWVKAGKPEGYDLNFWLAAENEIKRNTVYENLKLPICPECHNTKYVIRMDDPRLSMDDPRLSMSDKYDWFQCKLCGIKWHAKEGIMEWESPF